MPPASPQRSIALVSPKYHLYHTAHTPVLMLTAHGL
jgi:hypothetical protein